MDEHILKGNSAILKCHIPSFVSDFVVIDAWIDEETGEEFRYDAGGQLGTKTFFRISHFPFLSISLTFFCHKNVIRSFLSFWITKTLQIPSKLIFHFSMSLTAYLQTWISFFP